MESALRTFGIQMSLLAEAPKNGFQPTGFAAPAEPRLNLGVGRHKSL